MGVSSGQAGSRQANGRMEWSSGVTGNVTAMMVPAGSVGLTWLNSRAILRSPAHLTGTLSVNRLFSDFSGDRHKQDPSQCTNKQPGAICASTDAIWAGKEGVLVAQEVLCLRILKGTMLRCIWQGGRVTRRVLDHTTYFILYGQARKETQVTLSQESD